MEMTFSCSEYKVSSSSLEIMCLLLIWLQCCFPQFSGRLGFTYIYLQFSISRDSIFPPNLFIFHLYCQVMVFPLSHFVSLEIFSSTFCSFSHTNVSHIPPFYFRLCIPSSELSQSLSLSLSPQNVLMGS